MLDLKKEYRRIIEKTPIKGKSSELESQIYNAIVELFLQIPQNAKVIFRGAGVHTEELLYVLNKAIPQNHFSILAIVDDALCGDMLENIPIITKQQAASLKYDTVFISSFSYAEEMKTDYDEQKIQILDVYGYLEEKGIFLNAPFYYYQNGCYEIPHYYNNMYQRTLSYEALEYLIDAALELKDF